MAFVAAFPFWLTAGIGFVAKAPGRHHLPVVRSGEQRYERTIVCGHRRHVMRHVALGMLGRTNVRVRRDQIARRSKLPMGHGWLVCCVSLGAVGVRLCCWLLAVAHGHRQQHLWIRDPPQIT